MDFNFGYGNQHKITILRHSQALILSHADKPELSGVYIPKPMTGWEGATCQPFRNLIEYMSSDDVRTLYGTKVVVREKYLNARFSNPPSRYINVNFYPWSDPSDQTYVTFAKISDCYMGCIRLVKNRIHNNPRRLAMAMSLHPRIGAGSLFMGLVGEDVIRMVLFIEENMK